MGYIEVLFKGLQSDLGPVGLLQTTIVSFTVGVPILLDHVVVLGSSIVWVVIVLSTSVSIVVLLRNKDLVISVTATRKTLGLDFR